MEVNLIDVIDNNYFVKEIYPDGIKNFFLGNVRLGIDKSITLNIHSKDQPKINVEKWGKWGVNFNIVVIELSAFLIKSCKIIDWQDIEKPNYTLIIREGRQEKYNVKLTNEFLEVTFETHSLTFQRCSTYIL